jgi:N-acetyl-gamma-glutamyl-phosphate reductase
MEQIIARATNVEASIIFTPHLVPMTRGILSTIYLKPSDNVRAKQIADCWREAYQSQPFVRITKNIPATKDVSGSNYCDLWAGESGDRIIVVSTIDNLIKGASGAALQNFNVMYGMDQSWGLPL